ncbi:MAG: glycosyltransferase [Gammaproteobacteria bacterium]|nr:glycosyltransferase [Gammaproteobacteria bacterium]
MISVIIPVLNEEKALPQCVQNLLTQESDFETIIVDGGSTDNTKAIAGNFRNVLLVDSQRGRAAQMNTGASRANRDWLVFLHADTQLPANALHDIAALSADKTIQAGCFHQKFSGKHVLLRSISWLHNWRCNRSRIIYGDQCLFIRREFFRQLGGFPQTEILEDVMLSEKIVEVTRPLIMGQSVITDSRKFEQRGIVKSFLEIFIIMSCYELGLPVRAQDFFSPVR